LWGDVTAEENSLKVKVTKEMNGLLQHPAGCDGRSPVPGIKYHTKVKNKMDYYKYLYKLLKGDF